MTSAINPQERADWQQLYRRMRNVAAGYSNFCEESGSTRRLEKEFEQIDSDARAIPAPTPMGGEWQPISSAPKEGLIDIWTDRRHIDCYYDRICGEYRAITNGILFRLSDAKFWMPAALPPAPAHSGENA